MTATTMPSAPARSLAQRLDALAKGNRIRTFRRRLKEDVKFRGRHVDGYIADPPDELRTMKVFDLLLAQPTYGKVKVNHILKARNISPSKTIGGLTARQRGELLVVLRERRARG